MGNQGTAAGPFRRALELIRDGTLGEIREVHIWNDGGGADRKEPPKVRSLFRSTSSGTCGWGPAAFRPYHHEWLQRHLWREFGTCQLGNWASHTANLAFMALKVHDLWLGTPNGAGRPMIRVEATPSSINQLSFPRWEPIKWHIPARAGLPPVTFTWYNGQAPGARELIGSLKSEASDKDRQGMDFAGAYIVGTKGASMRRATTPRSGCCPKEQFRHLQRTGRRRPKAHAGTRWIGSWPAVAANRRGRISITPTR